MGSMSRQLTPGVGLEITGAAGAGLVDPAAAEVLRAALDQPTWRRVMHRTRLVGELAAT
jgi:hypothetical protein